MFPTLAAQAAFAHLDNHSDRTGADQRMFVAPRRLADAFGVALHPGGPVAAIVTINHDCTGICHVGSESAANRLLTR